MALLEGKTPAERKKIVAAIVSCAVALFLVLGYNLDWFSGSKSNTTNTNRRRPTSRPATQSNANTAEQDQIPLLVPVSYQKSTPDVPAPKRNIFAYYVPPKPVEKPPEPNPETQQPTPTPTPPLLVTSVTKQGGGPIYAKSGDFKLEVNGDKFTPETRIYFNGQELPTEFVSPQQLRTNIGSALVASPGARQVIVRTPDNQLYSNTATLNVAQPPAPSFTYVGILGTPRYSDKAILKNQKGELQTVQLGDLLDGRFRVTAISERAVEFTDQQLKIKHSIPFTEAPKNTSSYTPTQQPYTPEYRAPGQQRPPSDLSPMPPTRQPPPPSPQMEKKDGDKNDEDDDDTDQQQQQP